MTKHDAVKAYFEPKIQELAGELLFNFSPENEGSISLITNYSDRIRKEYITGVTEKAYGFTIVIVKPYSEKTVRLRKWRTSKTCQTFPA